MALWIKLSLLALLVVLPAQSSPSGHKEAKGGVLRSSSDRTPSHESVDHEGVESQQVSLITTIEYLPVEAKKIKPEEHGSHHSKAEESEDAGPTKTTKIYKESVGHEKSDKEAVSINLKEGHHKRGNKKYKGAGHKSSHSGAGDRVAKGQKGQTVGHKGHKNKGNNGKGFETVWKKEEYGRKKKPYDDAADLKHPSDRDHPHIHNEEEGQKQSSGSARESDHRSPKYGDKRQSQAGGSQDKIHKEEKSYGRREDRGRGMKYEKKEGHADAHGSSKGDQNHEDYENVEKHNNSDDFGNHGSQSRLRSVKVVVRKRKLGSVKSDGEGNPVKEASDDVVLEEEAPKEEKKYGEKKRKKKARTRARPTTRESSQTKTKPSEKVAAVQQTQRHRRIRKKKPSAKESTPKKVLLKRRINNALHGDPMSVFVRKEDLDKLKTSKVGRGKYAGHIAHHKIDPNTKKRILHEENNEITNDVAEEKESATTIEKPVVAAKSLQGSHSEDTSAEVSASGDPHLIQIPVLKKEKTQQVSVVSDVSMEHSSTGKESKPKSYKNSKAHKAVHYQAAGKKSSPGRRSIIWLQRASPRSPWEKSQLEIP